jgi:hypothetical protein
MTRPDPPLSTPCLSDDTHPPYPQRATRCSTTRSTRPGALSRFCSFSTCWPSDLNRAQFLVPGGQDCLKRPSQPQDGDLSKNYIGHRRRPRSARRVCHRPQHLRRRPPGSPWTTVSDASPYARTCDQVSEGDGSFEGRTLASLRARSAAALPLSSDLVFPRTCTRCAGRLPRFRSGLHSKRCVPSPFSSDPHTHGTAI